MPRAKKTSEETKPQKNQPTEEAKPKKKKAVKIDLSVEGLLKKANQAEAERLERAAALENKNEEELRPANTRIRPASPVHWGYGFSFDEAIDASERKRLTDLFSRFTQVGRSRGCFLVEGPNTPPERRKIDWEFGVVIELEQLLAQLPPNEHAPRMARLETALSDPKRWNEVVMLLSTWDEASLPAAIKRASEGLDRWPDNVRGRVEQWKERPALNALSRSMWIGANGEFEESAIEHATVLVTQNTAALLREQERFSRIKTLILSGSSGLDLVAAKLQAMTSIEQLELSQPTYSQGTSNIDLKALLAAPHLQNLKALSLYGYTIPKESLDALASCTQPLERLRIQYAKMKPAAANALSKLAAKKSLLSLDLKYNDLGPKGAAKLFSRPESWQRLRVLDISANEIGDVGTQAIAAASLSELRWLNISSNAQKEQLTERAAIALASSQMPSLYSLNLFGHPIKSGGVAALLEAKGLRGLRELNVGYCGWSIPELMESLGQGEPVAIERLDLKSPSRPGGPADWSKATFMKTVKTLNIETIDAKGIEGFFRCPHLENLEILVLGCAYGEEKEAIEAISNASLPGLKYLGLSGHKLDKQSAKKLAKSPLFRALWGVELMPTYTQPEAWRVFYDEGIPLVGYVHFDGNPANEYGSLSTWREEI